MNLKNWLTLTIKVLDFSLVAKQPDLVAQLRELTIAPHSGLNHELTRMLKDVQEREVNCKIILAYRWKQLIGWAICSKEDSDFIFTSEETKFRAQNGRMFQLFVKESHRRQGIGSEMYKAAVEIAGTERLYVSPWSNISYHFYSKFPSLNRENL